MIAYTMSKYAVYTAPLQVVEDYFQVYPLNHDDIQ